MKILFSSPFSEHDRRPFSLVFGGFPGTKKTDGVSEAGGLPVLGKTHRHTLRNDLKLGLDELWMLVFFRVASIRPWFLFGGDVLSLGRTDVLSCLVSSPRPFPRGIKNPKRDFSNGHAATFGVGAHVWVRQEYMDVCQALFFTVLMLQ